MCEAVVLGFPWGSFDGFEEVSFCFVCNFCDSSFRPAVKHAFVSCVALCLKFQLCLGSVAAAAMVAMHWRDQIMTLSRESMRG
jgi:hypothetical protein